MTLDEARNILGLGPDEEPASHMKAFLGARDQIAALIQNAPNKVIAERYRAGLIEFEAALEAVRLHLATEGSIENKAIEHTAPSKLAHPEIEIASDGKQGREPELVEALIDDQRAVIEGSVETLGGSYRSLSEEPISKPSVPDSLAPTVKIPEPTVKLEDRPMRKRNRPKRMLWILLVLLMIITLAGWLVLMMEQRKRVGYRKEIGALEAQGMAFVESRRWPEAREIYERMEVLQIDSEAASELRKAVAEGVENERRQFFQYWTNEAKASLEANRLDDSEAAIEKLFTQFPGHAEGLDMLLRIEGARATELLNTALQEARVAFEMKDWDTVIEVSERILTTHPDSLDTANLLKEALDRKAQENANRLKALELYKKAASKDLGIYDAEALEWVREAMLLDPSNEAIHALFEKLASYTRTFHVPDDFATLEETLNHARDRDRIVIAEGSWCGPVAINVAVELQGAGPDKTTFSCDGVLGSVMSFGPSAAGARVTGISFRHDAPDFQNERYSTVMVRGGSVAFANCHFLNASGHGLAVIEGGEVEVTHSRLEGNGWDGVNASGSNTVLRVSDCEIAGNFEHGIDLWNGAAGALKNNRCESNSRNGIHADSGAGVVTIEGNLLRDNREFGLVLTSGAGGDVAENIVSGNLIGGMAIRAAARMVEVRKNRIDCTDSPGIALEEGMFRDAYLDNTVFPTGEQAVPLLENMVFELREDK